MNIVKIFTINILFFNLVACSTTGGTIGGLLPAPKFTKGKIENSTYYSKGNEFSISIPHKKGSNEYTYMKIKEQYSDVGAYVSFGPAAVDQSIYRVEIGRKLSPQSKNISLESFTDSVVSGYIKQLESGYKTKISQVKREKLNINGSPSYYVELSQPNKSQPIKHQVYISDLPEVGVIFWVQSSSTGINLATINAIEFAESFKLIK